MAKNNSSISYDKREDILYLYKKGEKFFGNIDIGNIVIDITKKAEIKGIEIQNASKFLGFSKDGLAKMKGAYFDASVGRGAITINLFLKTAKIEKPCIIPIPLSKPIILQ